MSGRAARPGRPSARAAAAPSCPSSRSPRACSAPRASRRRRARSPAGAPGARCGAPLLRTVEEAANRALRLVAQHRERQPVAGVADGLVPGDVPPPVQLLLRVPGRLGELARELLDQLVD